MIPSRFTTGQSSAMRKSRLEGKSSMLPKPCRPASTDRLSSEARRPSTTGQRSSSAEPRGTFGANRLSREASATKIPLNRRSRSHQGERFTQSTVTPLRSSHFNTRATTTPVRTPSEDRSSRSWQTSLDRALAFVTIKDQRPLSNVAWQRAELVRVQEALAARAGEGACLALIRPLTIARFVDVAGALLAPIVRDTKLNTDNYVTKVPHVSKRLLYPGHVSKTWLKTVNTLHAFPHALALIAYLLDLANHIEMPVSEDWLYVGKDELSCLRRDYLYKCWFRFQDPIQGYQFEDLTEEYLQNLKLLLGNDDEKILELQQIINKYEACLEDEVEVAARADEARRTERCQRARALLRDQRRAREHTRALIDAAKARAHALERAARHADHELERAATESQQLKREVEEQTMSVAERAKLLDEVVYANRVQDSKRALAHQIDKMVHSKETELAVWQKKTLDSCMKYKQGLIHLSSQFPALASLAIDEKELMGVECAAHVCTAIETLKELATTLAADRARLNRLRADNSRRHAAILEETRAKIEVLQSNIQRTQKCVDEESSAEAAEAGAHSQQMAALAAALEALKANRAECKQLDGELEFWEKQNEAWQSKLSSMREYISNKRTEAARLIEEARAKRINLLAQTITNWQNKL